MKKILYILAVFPLVLTVSCSFLDRKNNPEILLEVAGNFLYKDDIKQLIPPNCTPEDSTKIADKFIQHWVTNVLIYDNAKRNITNTAEIEKLVEDYRKALMIHQYEQELISQRMKKAIQEDSLLHFYEFNSREFLVQDDIIKGILLIVPADTHQINDLREWMEKSDTESLEKIEKYVLQYAASYDYFLDKWFLLKDIENIIPFPINQTQLFKPNILIEQNDSTKRYLLKISEFKLRGEEMPYEYAKPKIETILRNKQKIEFIQAFENDIYNDALRHNKIKRTDK